MTILFFTRRFYPLIGGVEKHVMEVGKRLVTAGHRVIVVTESSSHQVIKSSSGVIPADAGISQILRHEVRHGQEREAKDDKVNGIEIIRIHFGKDDKFKKFRTWKKLWRLRDMIRQSDVVHCHDVFFWYLPFRLLYPRKRVYTTFHGYENYPIKKSAIAIRKLSEKLSWGNICIGDFIKKWYGTAPTFVSYGAVESEKRKAKSEKDKRDSAVFIGRLDNQTGILEYVKVVEMVKKTYPKFELLIVGDGKYKKHIEKEVKVLGFQENPEKYFEKFHFAFVSRYLSILEAFAAKRLVFALYDNPVKEDYLRMAPYAPWIIIEKEPKALAEKVAYFLNNPEKEKELVDKAYAWVKKQTWNEMVKLYEELWRIKQ